MQLGGLGAIEMISMHASEETHSNDITVLLGGISARICEILLPNFFQEASCFHLSMEWSPLEQL